MGTHEKSSPTGKRAALTAFHRSGGAGVFALSVLFSAALAQAGGARPPAALARDVRIKTFSTRRLSGSAAHPEADRRYLDLKAMTKQLLSTARPDESFFIGVGRTPTGLVAMLENLSPDLATSIPASGLKQDVPVAHDREYFAHFDRFVPASVLSGNRTMVFIDGSYGGGSAARLQAVFRRYLAAKGLSVPTRVVVFHDRGGVSRAGDIEVIGAHPHYHLQRSEPFAPFVGEHNIGYPGFHISTLDARVNPQFAAFREALHQQMAKDTELEGWLQARFPRLMDHTP